MSVISKIENNKCLPEKLQLYCENCDNALVKANDSSTGSFYDAFGLIWKHERKDSVRLMGDYVQVVFSICSECEKKGWK